MKSRIFLLSSLVILTAACTDKNFLKENRAIAGASANPGVGDPGVGDPGVGDPGAGTPGAPVTSGDGSGNCMMQKLYISNNAALYQNAITTQQNYLNTVIAGTAYTNDYYIQVRTMASIDLLQFMINKINSGTLVYNATHGGVSGLAAIDQPGGAFALDADIYSSMATYPGSLTPVLPVYGTDIFNALTLYIANLKNPAQAQYKYINFKLGLDMANRIDRAVAAQNSYVSSGHVNFNAIPKAKRFLCAGAFPSSIVTPTASEWVSKSAYERAVYRAAISAADATAIWNQLTAAQQAQMQAENLAVGL